MVVLFFFLHLFFPNGAWIGVGKIWLGSTGTVSSWVCGWGEEWDQVRNAWGKKWDSNDLVSVLLRQTQPWVYLSLLGEAWMGESLGEKQSNFTQDNKYEEMSSFPTLESNSPRWEKKWYLLIYSWESKWITAMKLWFGYKRENLFTGSRYFKLWA